MYVVQEWLGLVEILYLFSDVIGVEYPEDMTEPESFHRAMWVTVRICELMMEPMCAHPIYWMTLSKKIMKNN